MTKAVCEWFGERDAPRVHQITQPAELDKLAHYWCVVRLSLCGKLATRGPDAHLEEAALALTDRLCKKALIALLKDNALEQEFLLEDLFGLTLVFEPRRLRVGFAHCPGLSRGELYELVYHHDTF